MGNRSWLIATRNLPENCSIDWDSMNTDLIIRNWTLKKAYGEALDKRPKNLYEMANRWSDTKFCGYFDNTYLTALQEFCRHLTPYGCHPRLYFEYEGFDELHCLEFIPGTPFIQYGIYGFSEEMRDATETSLRENNSEYNDEIKTFEDAYYSLYHSFRNQLMETLPDKKGWRWEYIEVASEFDDTNMK